MMSSSAQVEPTESVALCVKGQNHLYCFSSSLKNTLFTPLVLLLLLSALCIDNILMDGVMWWISLSCPIVAWYLWHMIVTLLDALFHSCLQFKKASIPLLWKLGINLLFLRFRLCTLLSIAYIFFLSDFLFAFFLSQLEIEAKQMKQISLFVASVLGFGPLFSFSFSQHINFLLGLSCDITRSHTALYKNINKKVFWILLPCFVLFLISHASLNNVYIERRKSEVVRAAILAFTFL